MGDFNSHSPVWGCNSLDSRGKIIEDFTNNTNLCILNTKCSTYLHPAIGSRTSIDLSICDPSLMLDLLWTVHDDLCGSDHFPILIKTNKPASFPCPINGNSIKQIGQLLKICASSSSVALLTSVASPRNLKILLKKQFLKRNQPQIE